MKRREERWEFVCAVAGADCDCERVNAGPCGEILNLFGLGVALVARFDNNVVLDARKGAELAFNHAAVSVSVFNDLSCDSDVFFIGKA